MPTDPELIEFRLDDRDAVVDIMAALARDHDGWLNLQPAVDPDDIPADRAALVSRLFSARGPAVPLGSWVPGATRRDGTSEPISLGLQHGGGPHATWRLRDEGHPVPDGWRVLGDHARRGLVLQLPPDEDAARALDWLVGAALLLTELSLPETWVAGLYRPR